MDAINLIKTTAGLVTGLGVGTVVGNLIKSTTPANVKILNKILVGVGGFVIGGALSEIASNAVEQRIDEGVEALKKVRENVIETSSQED